MAVGPIFDGGFYLLAFADPLPALLEVPRSLDAMNRAFVIAHDAGVGIGLLRPERGLRGAWDVAAALADPLLDEELRGLLQGRSWPVQTGSRRPVGTRLSAGDWGAGT